ncbi:hypothetical protein E2320_002196, partial [Naja naja]
MAKMLIASPITNNFNSKEARIQETNHNSFLQRKIAISLNCQQKGHIARVCKSAKKTPQSQPLPPPRYQKHRDEWFT